MKKVLSLVLAICLTAGAVIAAPVTGFADASGQCGDNLTWTLDDDGTLTISGTGDMWDWPYPSGYSPWYNIKESVKKVTIKDGVTSVGDGAFRYCVGLISTTIPKSVAGIGEESFYGCDSLINIDVDRNNLNYSSINGDLYNKGRTELVQYAIGKNDALFDIPDGVISIRNSAFSFCGNLTGVTIPGSVTDIGEHAFMSCSSLINVTIPSSVSRIGDGAFASCSSLPDIVIPSGVMDIGGSAFVGCRSLVSITISDSVSRIGDSAFRGCVSLTNIDVDSNNPNYRSVSGNLYSKDGTKLIQYAVGKWDGLFNIPDSVTDIGIDAFCGCGLIDIIIPVSVISIDGRAFEECGSLRDVYYGGSKEEWNSVAIAWGNEPLTSAMFHYNSVSIPDSGQCGDNLTWTLDDKGTLTISGTGDMWDWNLPWFRNQSNQSIRRVEIRQGVSSIGSDAFDGCSNLMNINIPDSLTRIEEYAFADCTSLTSITIPAGVISISSSAFYGCADLMKINVDNNNSSFVSISGNLYSKDGAKLIQYAAGKEEASFDIPRGVTVIDRYAFSSCRVLRSVTIPDSVNTIGTSAFSYCSSLVSINVDSNNRAYSSLNGNLYDKQRTKLIQYAIGKKDASFDISSGVTKISDDAFYGCSNLVNITIPDGTTSIGPAAFRDCNNLKSIIIPNGVQRINVATFYDCKNLTSITIPDSVMFIGDSAFDRCSSLTSIAIPDGVTEIPQCAFYDCSRLTNVKLPRGVTEIENHAFYGCSNLVNITIPDNVTSIDYSAFDGCSSLTSISIPGSVTAIEGWAFNNCDSIKDVYYVGSEEKWNQINIGNNNDSLTSATIHYNYGSDKIRNIAVDNNTVHLTLKNNSDQAYDSVRLIVGIYEENGRQMCDMKSVTVKDFSIGYSGDIQLPFDEINPDGKIKIFLWDSSGLLKPITEACKTSVKSVSE